MNSKLLTFALLVVFGGGGFVLWQLFSIETPEPATSNQPAPATTTTSESRDVEAPLAGTGTLATLLERGQALECTISYAPETDEAVAVEGTYFVAGEDMRGDFVTTDAAGEEYVASMIKDADTLYTWSDIEGETYGMRIDLEALPEESAASEQPDTREPVPLDAQVSYDCEPWGNVDRSVFEPPRDVVFTDYSDILDGGMEFGTVYGEAAAGSGGAEARADACASCEQLPAEARTQCRAALGCRE